jgi:hypothetical protein
LGNALQAASRQFANVDHAFVGPIFEDGKPNQRWTWRISGRSPLGPRIQLDHYMSLRNYETWLKGQKDVNGALAKSLMNAYSSKASYPWSLQFIAR